MPHETHSQFGVGLADFEDKGLASSPSRAARGSTCPPALWSLAMPRFGSSAHGSLHSGNFRCHFGTAISTTAFSVFFWIEWRLLAMAAGGDGGSAAVRGPQVAASARR